MKSFLPNLLTPCRRHVFLIKKTDTPLLLQHYYRSEGQRQCQNTNDYDCASRHAQHQHQCSRDCEACPRCASHAHTKRKDQTHDCKRQQNSTAICFVSKSQKKSESKRGDQL